MDNLQVSVVIPTYNRAGMILRSLRSVLAAIVPGDEVIVVDDGSTDNTAEVLRPYGQQIRYIRTPNRGVGAARNRGVLEARHPLVAFNDSDDEWCAGKLQLQRTFMQAHPDVVFCCTDLGLRQENGAIEHHGLFGWHQDTRSWDEILGAGNSYSSLATLPSGQEDFRVHLGSMYQPLLRTNYVAAQSSMVRRDLAGADFYFAEDVKIHEEYECFIRLSRLGTAAYFDCETVWQWGHSDDRVSDAQQFQRATDRLKVLQRTYGKDADFLAQHGQLYAAAMNATRKIRARHFLRAAKLPEAREELQLIDKSAFSYRLLANAPVAVVRGIFSFHHFLRGLTH